MISVDTIEYQDDGLTCEGFVAYDQKKEGKRPGILIIHDWMGVSSFVRGRAEQLAAMGYVALTADIYGKGVRPKTGEEAANLAGKYRTDRAALEKTEPRRTEGPEGIPSYRLRCGWPPSATVLAVPAVLELARSGVEMAGFVTFHGGLETPNPETHATSGVRCSFSTAPTILSCLRLTSSLFRTR